MEFVPPPGPRAQVSRTTTRIVRSPWLRAQTTTRRMLLHILLAVRAIPTQLTEYGGLPSRDSDTRHCAIIRPWGIGNECLPTFVNLLSCYDLMVRLIERDTRPRSLSCILKVRSGHSISSRKTAHISRSNVRNIVGGPPRVEESITLLPESNARIGRLWVRAGEAPSHIYKNDYHEPTRSYIPTGALVWS